MNEIVNKLLLAGDKFMLEMHLKQPRFTRALARKLKLMCELLLPPDFKGL